MVFSASMAHLRPAFFRKVRLIFPVCFIAGAGLEYVFCKYGGYTVLIKSEAKARFMQKHDDDLYWLDRRERERRGLVYQFSKGFMDHPNPAMVVSTGPVVRKPKEEVESEQ